jgi:hypothetical protein
MKAIYKAQQGNHYDKNRFKKVQEANQAESLKAALKGLMKSSAKKRKTVEPEQPAARRSQWAQRFHRKQPTLEN